MKLPPDSETTAHSDEDIKELFKKQAINIPAALDNSILAASKVEQSSTKTQRRSTFPPSWLAMAAAVVMAVVVAPLMLTSPESALESERLKAPAQEKVPASISILADELPAISSESVDLQAPQPTKKAVPRALIRSDSTEMLPMNLNFSAEPEPFRSTADNWIAEINRLILEGQLMQAKEEYDLFKSVHPSHVSNIQFPEE